MDKKIGYGIAGAVLILALVFSLYTPESNLVGYASKSIGVEEIFEIPEVMQQASGGTGGTACTSMNEWEVCPTNWQCWNGYCRSPCFDDDDCGGLYPRCYLGMCLPARNVDDGGGFSYCGPCGKNCNMQDDPGEGDN
jgi:hypothetical protein